MFVTFEGPEGSGKSTVIKSLADRLKSAGRNCLATREPGAGAVGNRIRQIVLEGDELDQRCELFLFLADRSQHIATVVRPALEEGTVVLCDRHADSTVVYQGHARGLDVELLRDWNTFATHGLKPDLTLLLDLDPQVGLSRIVDKDRLDREPIEFHRKVREGFLAEAAHEPGRWVVVDADQSRDQVADLCWSALRARLDL